MSRQSSRKISRRMVLRGAGSIAIALPFLEELMPRASAADDDGIPYRLFTMSFGLGIEEAMQLERFTGPLQPFEPFASKAAFFTNVEGSVLAASGTPHFSTSAGLFTGVPQAGEDGNYHAGGPSMEQVMKRALHPSGVPNVATPELSVGIFSRTGAVSQFTRHWNTDGSPGQRPERRPTTVFNRLFGSYDPDSGDGQSDPQAVVRNHVNRSVLDTVMGQYQALTSERSKLGAASKARIENHLASIRDVETQLAPEDDEILNPLVCEPPAEGSIYDPDGYSFYDAANGATGAGAPAIDWEVAEETMRLIGEIMALGVSCDVLRFGSMLCVGGGGHVRFQGTYSALGESLDFGSTFGDGSPHDRIFHDYKPAPIRIYQHFCIAQLTHMLAKMESIVESNGKTVLDNSLVLLGTEYGQNHSASNVFHGVLGGGGRFNPGWYDQPLIPSDIYHESLAAYGVDSEIGSRWADFQPTEISGFRNV